MLKQVLILAASFFALLTVSACGLRGSLYLPEDRPDASPTTEGVKVFDSGVEDSSENDETGVSSVDE